MYLNVLTKIRNAQAVRQESVKVPFSNFDAAILEVLEKRKFIESVAKKGRMPKRILEVQLRYTKGKGAITGMRVQSTFARRLYVGYKELRPIRQGFGISVLSTPKGILDDRTARREKVGGQLLFDIW
ncbi:MAG TPA: 30S ribosomal protein S8 [Candidatus Paceibacterota bacterium]